MTTAPAALRAAQLIYTNVEADESPSGRRGFQIWLASPNLSEPLRRDIAKRLGDFKAPAGLRPGEPIRRHVFFSGDDGARPYFVLAQTMPLAERDMFGRGGRFYAHAFVFAQEEMARVGFNPFALLDGGIAFQSSPSQGKESAPQWRQGIVPEVSLQVGDYSCNLPAPPLLRDLAGYLEQSDYQPIAVTEPADAVLNFLRSLFHWLPPGLRRAASFDTLSTGQSLGTLPYRFAGAQALDQYRRWTYRRTNRLDLAGERIAPPLAAGDSFFNRLLSRWLEAGTPPPDEQSEALYALLRAIAELRPAGCQPAGLSAEQLREALALPGVAECVEKLRANRIESDLDDEFLRSLIHPLVREYLQVDDLAEGLRRIATPIPREQLETWLIQALTGEAMPRLTPAQAQMLQAWLVGRDNEKVRRCRLIAQRWFGDVEKIAAFLHDSPDDAEREWLRAWLIRSLDVVFPGEGEPALRLRDALDAGPGDPEQLAEAEMFLAAAGTSDLDSDAVRLLVAFHRSQAGNLVTVLQGAFGDELRDFTINRFETADVRGDFRCYHFDGEFHLGVEATFRGRDARKLAALGLAFFEQNSQKTMRFWLGRASADLPHLNEGRISSWLDPNGELLQCVKRERWDELSRRLRTANDSQFQDFAQTVGGKYTARPAFYRTADNAFWVGIRLSLLDPKTKARDNELMEAVLTSALPVLALESWQNLARPAAADTIDRHRIAWLMKFLLDPLTLGKFAINR